MSARKVLVTVVVAIVAVLAGVLAFVAFTSLAGKGVRIPSRRSDENPEAVRISFGLASVDGHAEQVFDELVAMGEEAVPTLTRLLSSHDWTIRRGAAEALARIGEAEGAVTVLLSVFEGDPDWRVRAPAALALGEAGVGSQEVVDALVRALGDEHMGWYAAKALAGLGPKGIDAVDVLEEAVASGSTVVQVYSRYALLRMGVDVQENKDALNEMLVGPDSAARTHVASAYEDLRPQDEASLAALGRAVRDDLLTVRDKAHKALVAIGPLGAEHLAKAAEDERAEVRMGAVQALTHMGEEAVPGLMVYAQDEVSMVRSEALKGFYLLGPKAGPAIPLLITMLQDEEGRIRLEAQGALLSIGEEAVPALVGALESPVPEVRGRVARTLGACRSVAVSALPTLTAKLESEEDETVRRFVQEAIDMIEAALSDSDEPDTHIHE